MRDHYQSSSKLAALCLLQQENSSGNINRTFCYSSLLTLKSGTYAKAFEKSFSNYVLKAVISVLWTTVLCCSCVMHVGRCRGFYPCGKLSARDGFVNRLDIRGDVCNPISLTSPQRLCGSAYVVSTNVMRFYYVEKDDEHYFAWISFIISANCFLSRVGCKAQQAMQNRQISIIFFPVLAVVH